MRMWPNLPIILGSAGIVCMAILIAFIAITKPPDIVFDSPKHLTVEEERRFSGGVIRCPIFPNGESVYRKAHAEFYKSQIPPMAPKICELPNIENPHEKYPFKTKSPKLPNLGEFNPELMPSKPGPPMCHGRIGPPLSPYLAGKVNKSGSCRIELQLTPDGLYDGVEWIKCSDDAFKEISLKNIERMFGQETRKECLAKQSKITYRLLDETGNIVPE